MTYTIRVLAAAERDIERATDWYAVEAPAHVERFEAELHRAIAKIAPHPLVPRVLVSGARRTHLEVYPYELWYLVYDDLRVIEIIALIHDRQDLSEFVSRIRL